MFRKQHHSIPIPLHLCISGGTLRFYGEWFGRPFDNFHVVQTAVRTKNALHIQFSEKEELTAIHPEGIINTRDYFAIKTASEIHWMWCCSDESNTSSHWIFRSLGNHQYVKQTTDDTVSFSRRNAIAVECFRSSFLHSTQNKIPFITISHELHCLQAYVRQLITIAEQNDSRPIPHCFQFCRTIDHNITICIQNHYADIDILMEYIQADWKSAMNVHTGLPEYYIQDEKDNKQKRKNQKIEALIHKIDQIIAKLSE